ncbi:MAG: hypothetical protein ACLP50_03020 [Solirubrobacteraceae bacterium]
MSAAAGRGPIVIDTDVFSADLIPKSPLPAAYSSLIAGRPAWISFKTAAELRVRRDPPRLGTGAHAQA